MVFLSIVFLIIGFILLIKGADFFVDASSSIARKLRIPSIIIGLTIVAFGTSAPELAVSASAAIMGSNDIALGNVIGSNLFNFLVVIGISALLSPMFVDRETLKKDFPFSIIAAVVLLLVSIDTFSGGTLARTDGILLLVFFVVYIYSLVMSTLKARKAAGENEEVFELRNLAHNRPGTFYKKPNFSLDKGPNIFFTLFVLIVGLVAIVFGGDLVVDNAVALATKLGISENLIALTIVAFGTSLPELVTSIVASRKGENDIAIGNVVGSNIFNIFMILGISATIHPIAVSSHAIIDLVILVAVFLIFFVPMLVKKKAGKVTGSLMLLSYVLYMAYIIIRTL